MDEEIKRMETSNHGEEDHEMLSMSMIGPATHKLAIVVIAYTGCVQD